MSDYAKLGIQCIHIMQWGNFLYATSTFSEVLGEKNEITSY